MSELDNTPNESDDFIRGRDDGTAQTIQTVRDWVAGKRLGGTMQPDVQKLRDEIIALINRTAEPCNCARCVDEVMKDKSTTCLECDYVSSFQHVATHYVLNHAAGKISIKR